MSDTIRDALLRLVAPRARPGQATVGTVALYGDSIMHGGIAQHLRALRPELVIVDRSLPGDTARQCWRRLPYEVRNAQFVVLQHGTNDVTGGADPVPWLRAMVQRIQAEGRLPILTGVSQRADGAHAAVNARLASLAAEEFVLWADWQSVPLDTPDGLHPSEAMARMLAARLASLL